VINLAEIKNYKFQFKISIVLGSQPHIFIKARIDALFKPLILDILELCELFNIIQYHEDYFLINDYDIGLGLTILSFLLEHLNKNLDFLKHYDLKK
jgi:hypothetical protein